MGIEDLKKLLRKTFFQSILLSDKDAPLSLKSMYFGVDSVISAHAPDYHVSLIAPREMSDAGIPVV